MGTINVQVSFTTDKTYPAPGVFCFVPGGVAEATADVNGLAALSVAGGTYTVQCRPAANGAAGDYADDMAAVTGISVPAGATVAIKVTATRTNPVYFTTPPSVTKAAPLGTGTVNVGAASGGATITVAPVASKSVLDVTLDDSNKFTLPDVDQILAGLGATYDTSTTPATRKPGRGLYGAFELPLNPGFVGVGDGASKSLAKALAFKVTASDTSGHTTSVTVVGAIGGFQDIQGGLNPSSASGTFGVTNATGPVGVMAIASEVYAYKACPSPLPTTGLTANCITDPTAYSWTVTAADKDGALTIAPDLLKGATTRNPYFVPTLEGVYTLVNSAPGFTPDAANANAPKATTFTHTLVFTAASYAGVLDATDGVSAGACAQCHDAYPKMIKDANGKNYTGVADYFFHAMGVHGNHNYFSDVDSRNSEDPGAATIFQWGLQGTDYGPTCYRCHTTGSFYTNSNGADATVDNGGFQARMNAYNADAILTDPTAKPINQSWTGDGVDHWTGLDGGMKAVAGIQCESCHGPASQHMAMGGWDSTTKEAKGLTIPWGVSACAVCHDSPGHHDKVELWSKSGHANSNLAVLEGAASGSCARCHGAQGFKAFADQVADAGKSCSSYQKSATDTTAYAPTNGNLAWADNLLVRSGNPQAPAACWPATDLSVFSGLSTATVQPQTCSACHEPHSTELRVKDNTGDLAAGFSVQGAGAGALCMTCHNGRNGPRGDSVTIASIAASHTPTQTEILFDQNFYWVNGIVSPHAAVGDTCVGCHVQLHPDSVITGNDNHTFEADGTICKNCHGASTQPETLFGQYSAGYKKLASAMLTALTTGRTTFDIKGSKRTVTIDIAANKPTIVGFDRSGFTFVFATDIENPNVVATDPAHILTAGTKLSSSLAATLVTATTTPICINNGRMAKAGWNMSMLNDQSSIVHNPLLVPQVFTVSAQKVGDATAGTL
jgi:hypothetical protein